MPGVLFPYPPVDPPGPWSVQLPHGGGALGNAIGEVKVYATASVTGTLDLRWKCDESALPLLEAGGFNHQLSTSVGTLSFLRGSMRDDGTGHAVSIIAGAAHDGLQMWTPSQPAPTLGFGWAGLLGVDTVATANPYVKAGAAGVCQFQRSTSSFSETYRGLYLWDGSAWHEVNGSLPAGTFYAMRVDATGAYKWWVDSTTGTGSYGGFSPDAWQVFFQMDDQDAYKVQEIHVWHDEPTDADIEAVRLDLIGI